MMFPFGGYGNIYPAFGGYDGYGGCNHNYPLNYHSHGSLLGTAIGGLITGDYSGYRYAPNPVYSPYPFGGYGLGYGGYGMGFGGYGMGLGYGGFGGYGMGLGYGGFGYGFGNVPYGGFFWGATPNLPSCTGHFNNYRSGQNAEPPVLHPTPITPEKPAIAMNQPSVVIKTIPQVSLFRV